MAETKLYNYLRSSPNFSLQLKHLRSILPLTYAEYTSPSAGNVMTNLQNGHFLQLLQVLTVKSSLLQILSQEPHFLQDKSSLAQHLQRCTLHNLQKNILLRLDNVRQMWLQVSIMGMSTLKQNLKLFYVYLFNLALVYL